MGPSGAAERRPTIRQPRPNKPRFVDDARATANRAARHTPPARLRIPLAVSPPSAGPGSWP